MLRTPHFYALYAMFLMMATGGLLVTAQAGPVAKSWGIASALLLATTLNPIANGASRISWGWVSDRFGRENTMVVAFSLQAVCLLLVLTLGRLSGAFFIVTLVLVFFTWGEVFSLFPSISGDYFGTRRATSNYAWLYTAKGVSSILGGVVAALLFFASSGRGPRDCSRGARRLPHRGRHGGRAAEGPVARQASGLALLLDARSRDRASGRSGATRDTLARFTRTGMPTTDPPVVSRAHTIMIPRRPRVGSA